MTKGGILEDSFEQLVELGSSTAKKTVKSVVQTLNPFDKTSGGKTSEVDSEQNQTRTSEVKHDKNHTSLDFKKLQEKFKDKEKIKVDVLRSRLFQIVRRDDEKSLERKKMAEAEKKRQEEYLTQEKKRKEQEKKQREQQSNISKGKTRRSIFSSKKIAERQHIELKPATGKQ